MRCTTVIAAVTAVVTGAVGLSGVAHADGGDPVGAFDSVAVAFPFPFSPSYTPWVIHGWAADPDAPGQVIGVDIYIDGELSNASSPTPGPGTVPTGLARPDVAAVFPFAGDNSGWSAGIVVSDGRAHDVCAYARNVGSGTENTTLGCQEIPPAGTTNLGDPQGSLEAVSTAPGIVRVQGWAGDPDPDAVTTPVRVFQDGRPLVHVEPSLDRPDVHAALPALTNAAGFDAIVPALPGLHIYCVDAGNTGNYGTNNTSLGCVLRDVPGAPAPSADDLHGAFDAVVRHFDPQTDNPGGTFLEGWVWDPTNAPPYHVTIRGIDRAFDIFGGVVAVDGTTTEPRPDVHAAFPDAPSDTGFKIDIPATIATAHSPYTVYHCAYAERPGAEQFLGCISLSPL